MRNPPPRTPATRDGSRGLHGAVTGRGVSTLATLGAMTLLACSVSVGHVREPAKEPRKLAPARATKQVAAAKPTPAKKAAPPPAARPREEAKKSKVKPVAQEAPTARVAAREAKPAEDPSLRTFAVAIRVPLAIVREEIEKRVPTRYARGWELVTRPGESPSIEARITVWRDAVGLRVDGDVVHVELPLRYAAEVRGNAKTPFGKSIALAKGQSWGTEAHPQSLTLRGRARVSVSDAWELGIAMTFDDPKHGDAPSGSICSAGAVQICVPKETLAPIVRKKFDAEIQKRLAKLDALIVKKARTAAALPTRAKTLWSLLGCPVPLDPAVKFDCATRKAVKTSTRWLVLDPLAADLALRGDADALVVEPRVTVRVERAEGVEPPRREVRPLPPRGKLPEGAPATNIDTSVTFDVEELRRLVRERVAPEVLREAKGG